MKVFKFIGTTIITTFFLFNVASCSNDDDTFAEEEESENVDFTNYISTNLKVNGKTFWYEPNWSGVHISDWGDNDRGIHFSFEGKTEDTDNESIIKISLNESLSMADCVNNNKNIIIKNSISLSPHPPSIPLFPPLQQQQPLSSCIKNTSLFSFYNI